MSSRPQVTITLGHSGQVVKRAADVSSSDYMPSLEGKRPVRERLGSNMDTSHLSGQAKSKRQRLEKSDWSADDVQDQYASKHRVDRHDLRFKLIEKSLSKRSIAPRQNEVDLRERLSRNAQVSSRFDARDRVPESRSSGLVRRVPPIRSADDLLELDSLRKSYSSWTLDGPGHISPDRLLGSSRGTSPTRKYVASRGTSPARKYVASRGTSPPRKYVAFRGTSPPRKYVASRGTSPPRKYADSRGISPPRRYEGLQHIPSFKPLDASRPPSFMANGVADTSRHTNLTSKTAVPVEAVKPVMRAPSGGIIQKNPYMSEEPLTVSGLLGSLGLGKYAILFQAEEVDMSALKQMSDSDLKELGIPMGPRKKILLAVLSRRKQRHR